MTGAEHFPDRLRAVRDAAEEDIVAKIYDAVVEQRLPPGTKLSEASLCAAFGASRMRIRRALLVLANRQVVELRTNRGAYVAVPSPADANDVFEARLTIEPALARLACQRASDAQIDLLHRHLDKEHQAHIAGNRRDAIRLSGQFHMMLAAIAGNAVLERTVRDLISRSSLIVGVFGDAGVASCRDDDHSRIAQALRNRDSDMTAALIRDHLSQIQRTLRLDEKGAGDVDVVRLLSDN